MGLLLKQFLGLSQSVVRDDKVPEPQRPQLLDPVFELVFNPGTPVNRLKNHEAVLERPLANPLNLLDLGHQGPIAATLLNQLSATHGIDPRLDQGTGSRLPASTRYLNRPVVLSLLVDLIVDAGVALFAAPQISSLDEDLTLLEGAEVLAVGGAADLEEVVVAALGVCQNGEAARHGDVGWWCRIDVVMCVPGASREMLIQDSVR